MDQMLDSDAIEASVRAAWEGAFSEPLEADRSLFETVLPDRGVFRAVHLNQFVNAVNAATGLELPLTTVFAADTPRKLSAVVRARAVPAIRRPFLMRAGIGRPLFVIPGIGGMGLDMLEVIEELRFPGPIYLNVSSGVDRRERPLTTFTDTIADQLAMLRRVQAAGPYLILGYSWGGQVAIEVARALQAEGETVDFLGAIDPQLTEPHWPFTIWLGYAGRRLRHHLRRMRGLPLEELAGYAFKRALPLVGRFARKFGIERPLGWNPYDQEGLPDIIDEVWRAEVAVSEDYRMQFFSGKVALFLSREGEAALASPERLWRRYVRQLEVHWLPGDHLALMRRPEVRNLTDCISECLERWTRIGAAGR